MGLDPCEAKSKGKGSWQGQGQGHGQRKLWLSSDTLRGDCTQQCGRLEGWFWTSVPTLIERATTPSAQLTREGIRDNARYQQWGSRVAARLVQTWRIPPYGPTAQFGARLEPNSWADNLRLPERPEKKRNHCYPYGHRLGGYMLELRSLESDVPRSPLDLGPPASGRGGLIVRSRQ